MPLSGYLGIGRRDLKCQLRGTLLEVSFRNADRKLGDADAFTTFPEGFDGLGIFRPVLLFADRAKRLSRGPVEAQSRRRPHSSLSHKTLCLCYPLADSTRSLLFAIPARTK